MINASLFPPFSITLLLLITIAHSQPIKTLSIAFDRELKETDNREHASGTIYYQSPNKLVVVVDEPINQWMIFGKERLEIYYPDDAKAFRFTSKFPFQLSFFQAFMGVLSKDYGLSDLGYVLVKRSVENQTVTTTWKPPKELAKTLGEFILVHENDKIVRAESKKADGITTSRSLFSNHLEYQEVFFPMEIATSRFFENDSSFERIVFSEAKFDPALPQNIIYFTIPDSISVEESEW